MVQVVTGTLIQKNENGRLKGGFSKDIVTLVLSCAAIIIGANYFVDESIFFCRASGSS